MMQNGARDAWCLRVRAQTHENLTLAELSHTASRTPHDRLLIGHAELDIEGVKWVEFESEAPASAPEPAPRCPGAKCSLPPFPAELLCAKRIPLPPPPGGCKDRINSALPARVEALETSVHQLTDFIVTLYRNHH